MSQPAFDPVQILTERFQAAIVAAFPAAGMVDPLISPGRNPKFGDFQCNAAMSLAKQLGKQPREVASAILKHVQLGDLAEPLTDANVAGPGFINITLKTQSLAALLGALDTPELGVAAQGQGHTVVVDLCGVNLAKQMHVGHLRSTIIGDALARVLARVGYTVIRQNHVGDWGLPIAMVTAKLMQIEASGNDTSKLNLDGLEKLYRDAKVDCDADEKGLAAAQKFNLGPKVLAELTAQVEGAREALAKAKATLLGLQSHDERIVRVWQRIADITLGECLKTCARLNTIVTTEHSAGESSYAEELAPLVEDLIKRSIAESSSGALVVRVEGIEEPCLVRKSDGGFLYATTDMAAIRRRVQKFKADRVIYCVDSRQALHFKQVFGAAAKAGFATLPGTSVKAVLQHAGFGTVLGEDGRPFKTRSGDNVKLADLLDEATERAAKVAAEKNPELSLDERRAVAEAVGIAAIKYADLSNDRIKDYVFSFDRMLAFEGNTGPYLLFALVRMRSIVRKAIERDALAASKLTGAAISIAAVEEKALALQLLRYPSAVRSVAETLEPHRLCGFLYELAQAFSSFVTNCPVLQAPDDATKLSRLRICNLADRVLTDGLQLLGIRQLDRM